jgi:hypothetical protein
MRVLLLYESRRGFTMTVARAIRDDLRARGVLATTAPLRTVDAGTLAAADALMVGTWVQGFVIAGVGPADGALEGIARLPQLGGRPTVVFCTCEVAPRATLHVLSSRLAAKGANVVATATFKRKKSLRKVAAFVDTVLPELEGAPAPA